MNVKIDLVKQDKSYYCSKAVPQEVNFKEVRCLSIVGQGEPAGPAFTEAVQALYPLAYGVKGISKKSGRDFAVPKLEGLWWVVSEKPALEVPRSQWHWKLLIRVPDFVEDETVAQARAVVHEKNGLAVVKDIKFETLCEGRCVQILHVGPYKTEPESLAKLESFMKLNGLLKNGFHHEIYLSDPRKTSPEKMKTILRQPVK